MSESELIAAFRAMVTESVCICIEAGEDEKTDKLCRDMLWKIAGASDLMDRIEQRKVSSATGGK